MQETQETTFQTMQKEPIQIEIETKNKTTQEEFNRKMEAGEKDFRNLNLSDISFEKNKIGKDVLIGCDFSGSDFSLSIFTNYYDRNSKFEDCIFIGCNLENIQYAEFKKCSFDVIPEVLYHLSFIDIHLDDINLKEKRFFSCSFDNCILPDQSKLPDDLKNTTFKNIDFSIGDYDFSDKNIITSIFSNCKFGKNCIFPKDCSHVRFTDCDLQEFEFDSDSFNSDGFSIENSNIKNIRLNKTCEKNSISLDNLPLSIFYIRDEFLSLDNDSFKNEYYNFLDKIKNEMNNLGPYDITIKLDKISENISSINTILNNENFIFFGEDSSDKDLIAKRKENLDFLNDNLLEDVLQLLNCAIDLKADECLKNIKKKDEIITKDDKKNIFDNILSSEDLSEQNKAIEIFKIFPDLENLDKNQLLENIGNILLIKKSDTFKNISYTLQEDFILATLFSFKENPFESIQKINSSLYKITENNIRFRKILNIIDLKNQIKKIIDETEDIESTNDENQKKLRGLAFLSQTQDIFDCAMVLAKIDNSYQTEDNNPISLVLEQKMKMLRESIFEKIEIIENNYIPLINNADYIKQFYAIAEKNGNSENSSIYKTELPKSGLPVIVIDKKIYERLSGSFFKHAPNRDQNNLFFFTDGKNKEEENITCCSFGHNRFFHEKKLHILFSGESIFQSHENIGSGSGDENRNDKINFMLENFIFLENYHGGKEISKNIDIILSQKLSNGKELFENKKEAMNAFRIFVETYNVSNQRGDIPEDIAIDYEKRTMFLEMIHQMQNVIEKTQEMICGAETLNKKDFILLFEEYCSKKSNRIEFNGISISKNRLNENTKNQIENIKNICEKYFAGNYNLLYDNYIKFIDNEDKIIYPENFEKLNEKDKLEFNKFIDSMIYFGKYIDYGIYGESNSLIKKDLIKPPQTIKSKETDFVNNELVLRAKPTGVLITVDSCYLDLEKIENEKNEKLIKFCALSGIPIIVVKNS